MQRVGIFDLRRSCRRRMNILMLGDETANALGSAHGAFPLLSSSRSRRCSPGAAIAVGRDCISFVGLIVPHIARLLVGSDSQVFSFRRRPCSGSRWSSVCDTVGRVILPPGEVPVSIILSFIGAPFFLYLLRTREGKKGRILMYFGFRNLSVSYGKKEVLRSLDVDVPRGKVVTVIGQNGCGKSTMLKTVSKAVTPKRGEVVFCDRRLGEYAPKKLAQQIAYLSQVHESPPDIDVRTLVSYGRYPYSKFGRGLTQADADIIDRALALTGLTALQDRILSTLSGGERQRAWIAMTIAQEPEILILDEPTTYLDVSYQVEVLELVKKLNRELGITIIMVLHDIDLAARYSDVLMAVKGRPAVCRGHTGGDREQKVFAGNL